MPRFARNERSDTVRAWESMRLDQKEMMWIGVVHGIKFLMLLAGDQQALQMGEWLNGFSFKANEAISTIDQWYKQIPDSIQPPTQLMVNAIVGNYEGEHGDGSWRITDVRLLRMGTKHTSLPE